MDAEEVINQMKLDEIKERNYNMQACSAMTKEGLNEGLEWLIKELNRKNE